MEIIAVRSDGEKGRQAAYRMIETLAQIADEMEELRRGLGDVTKEIVRGK